MTEPYKNSSWDCEICTFTNTHNKNCCEMCGCSHQEAEFATESDLPHPPSAKEWTCAACTFTNANNINCCEICGNSREDFAGHPLEIPPGHSFSDLDDEKACELRATIDREPPPSLPLRSQVKLVVLEMKDTNDMEEFLDRMTAVGLHSESQNDAIDYFNQMFLDEAEEAGMLPCWTDDMSMVSLWGSFDEHNRKWMLSHVENDDRRSFLHWCESFDPNIPGEAREELWEYVTHKVFPEVEQMSSLCQQVVDGHYLGVFSCANCAENFGHGIKMSKCEHVMCKSCFQDIVTRATEDLRHPECSSCGTPVGMEDIRNHAGHVSTEIVSELLLISTGVLDGANARACFGCSTLNQILDGRKQFECHGCSKLNCVDCACVHARREDCLNFAGGSV